MNGGNMEQYIYRADVWCHNCAEKIKLSSDVWRQWVESKVRSGFVPTIKQVADTAKITKLESELAMLRRSWEPSGNPNCPATKRFYAVKQELADGPTKADYRLVKGDAVFTCTKTEYDYALTLPMGINFN